MEWRQLKAPYCDHWELETPIGTASVIACHETGRKTLFVINEQSEHGPERSVAALQSVAVARLRDIARQFITDTEGGIGTK